MELGVRRRFSLPGVMGFKTLSSFLQPLSSVRPLGVEVLVTGSWVDAGAVVVEERKRKGLPHRAHR